MIGADLARRRLSPEDTADARAAYSAKRTELRAAQSEQTENTDDAKPEGW